MFALFVMNGRLACNVLYTLYYNNHWGWIFELVDLRKGGIDKLNIIMYKCEDFTSSGQKKKINFCFISLDWTGYALETMRSKHTKTTIELYAELDIYILYMYIVYTYNV